MIKIKPSWFFLPPVQFYKKTAKYIDSFETADVTNYIIEIPNTLFYFAGFTPLEKFDVWFSLLQVPNNRTQWSASFQWWNRWLVWKGNK